MTSASSFRPRIAFLGTYLPTRCGLATFTHALAAEWLASGRAADIGVIRMVDGCDAGTSSHPVVAEWVRGSAESREEAIRAANTFDVVVVQHEFGIYPGLDGEDVVAFCSAMKVPLVVVLHTVLAAPNEHQRQVVEAVSRCADVVVAQTNSARRRLLATTSVDPHRVRVIPHGAMVPPVTLGDRSTSTRIVLTWGHLGPGKGIEHGIAALAHLDDLVPKPLYVVAGRTHPNVVAREGEHYREGLRAQAVQLGLGEQVVFDDRYRTLDELARLITSADVVLLPYDSTEQVTSGVLVEAIAAGRPVVATEFPHAVEMLASGAGLTVPHHDPEAMAAALRTVLTRPTAARAMHRAAERQASALAWSSVATQYADDVDECLGRLAVA
jgi:polysaccharide biosynthesis protein PslF